MLASMMGSTPSIKMLSGTVAGGLIKLRSPASAGAVDGAQGDGVVSFEDRRIERAQVWRSVM
jgi:hypothetical protein